MKNTFHVYTPQFYCMITGVVFCGAPLPEIYILYDVRKKNNRKSPGNSIYDRKFSIYFSNLRTYSLRSLMFLYICYLLNYLNILLKTLKRLDNHQMCCRNCANLHLCRTIHREYKSDYTLNIFAYRTSPLHAHIYNFCSDLFLIERRSLLSHCLQEIKCSPVDKIVRRTKNIYVYIGGENNKIVLYLIQMVYFRGYLLDAHIYLYERIVLLYD